MNKYLLSRLLPLLLLTLMVSCKTSKPEGPIRVACIGTSITYGAGVASPEQNSYPAQLGRMLGDGYEVVNFGLNGSTAIPTGGLGYDRSEKYADAREFKPDIVIIEFGTNDSKHEESLNLFEADYLRLINSFREKGEKPRIILTVPIPAYCDTTAKGSINNRVLDDIIIPKIQAVAYNKYLELVNLNFLFPEWQEHLMPDGIHPSSIGAGIIASRLCEQIENEGEWFDIFKNLDEVESTEVSNFYGFICQSFDYDGLKCKIVQPKTSAEGHPFIWRARFWGHEPQTDISLLERGFHVVYCDVADLYGSSEAVARWDRFYELLQRGGLSQKAVLEGMSRGGLVVYNWAAANGDKVACVYADAPVLDIKSWPMGKSDTDTKNLMNVYGFADSAEYTNFAANPLDNAAEIATFHFPILHIVGDADDVVPVAENTQPFEQKIRENGGLIEVIHKPDVGHHPHSLKDPGAITRFILRAKGMYQNQCTVPVCGNEFRSAAGWSEGSDWSLVAGEISEILNSGTEVDLLLLGNSITQGFGGDRQRVTYKPGRDALDKALGHSRWVSAGISGDKTQNVLWRIENGKYGAAKPKTVIISIGVNNLTTGDYTPDEIAEGIISCSRAAVKEFPEARIVSFGLYPAGLEPDTKWRTDCDKIYEYLAQNPVDGVKFINPKQWFVEKSGKRNTDLYGPDYLHFSEKGYEMISEKIAEICGNRDKN